MYSLNSLIENKNIQVDKTKYFSAIIGESPSKGAKSPTLWNEAFKKINFPSFMHPIDILPKNLGELIKNLRLNKRFIGGAVTMPYKIDILKFLDHVDDNAKVIGAVNCIYRGNNGELIGTNTDGAGALWSLKSVYGDLNEAKVLLVGAGGAALAVATYIAKSLGKKGKLFISNRSKEKLLILKKKLSKNACGVDLLSWPPPIEKAKEFDIIINCTSIGFENLKKDSKGIYSLKFFTPLGHINNITRVPECNNPQKEYVFKAVTEISKNIIETTRFLSQCKNTMVFDVIYQPRTTYLLFLSDLLGLKTLSGKKMNLEQAVIAFDKTTSATGLRNSDQDEVRKLMEKVS